MPRFQTVLSIFFFSATFGLFASPDAIAGGVPASLEELNGSIAIGSCSAALVDLGDSDENEAYVLSAGHCPRYPFYVKPEKAYALEGSWKAVGFPMGSTLKTPTRVEVPGLAYATMTHVDLAIFRTEKTVAEFRTEGFRVFKLAHRLPAPGARLRVTSAFWKQTQSCVVERILRTNADELEIDPTPLNGYRFRNSPYFDSECQIRSGWSGSPVFDESEDKIYGVASRRITPIRSPTLSLFTGTVDLMKFMGFDSTRSDFGVLVASNILDFASCIRPNGRLDLTLQDCDLPKIDPAAIPGRKQNVEGPRG